MKKPLALFVLASATLLAAPSKALANDTLCVGALIGTFDNVVVPPGETCTLTGSTVNGSVKALENSRLNSIQNNIRGNIEGDKADSVDSQSDTVGGNIQIREATGSSDTLGVRIANATLTDGNIVIEKNNVLDIGLLDNTLNKGSIKVEENNVTRFLGIVNNNVAQNLQVFKNRGGISKSVVLNTVGENLQCKENDQPFVGTPNTARQSEGQCGTPPTP